MSPNTQEIQDYLQKLSSTVNKLPKTYTLAAKPTFKALLGLLSPSTAVSPAALVELLTKWLSCLQIPAVNIIKLTAKDLSMSQLAEVFELDFRPYEEHYWALKDKFLIDLPGSLQSQLDDVRKALYEDESEATCRISIDLILVQCRVYLRCKHEQAISSSSLIGPSTPIKGGVSDVPQRPFMLFPESNVSIHIKKQSAEFLITGRADWAMGYKSMGDEGSLLNAMEAKQRSEFSKGEAQLTAYLAILRENRRRAKKVNYRTQGFYSDGTRFGFLCITEEGLVRQSRIFDISKKGELKVVFSFIVNMMETAMKMTPTVTPTKPGPRRDLKIGSYHDEVWTEIYKWVHESVVVSPDSTEDDLIDIERCVSPDSTEDDLINIS